MDHFIDVRSDTVTQPTDQMRSAMAQAVVGDDGFGADPTVQALEARYAELVGKDAAIFVPSGVMANQIAMRIHTSPGDTVVAGHASHVVAFEMGASAKNAGIQFATFRDDDGYLPRTEVVDRIDAEGDHQAGVRAIVVENTNMFAGGRVYPLEELRALRRTTTVPIHMDGARLFNAQVASGVSAATYAAEVDTVMTCLSKGLCAPVGSLLAGSIEDMERGRVERKRLGGSMRQAGFLAAAGLVALDTMIARLADDHLRARRIADAVERRFGDTGYRATSCETNIVAFNHPAARDFVAQLEIRGILAGTVAPGRFRLVVHAGISDGDVETIIRAIEELV
jgi:threonine aldolase